MECLIWYYKFNKKNTFDTPFMIDDNNTKTISVMKATIPCKVTKNCLRIKLIDNRTFSDVCYLYLISGVTKVSSTYANKKYIEEVNNTEEIECTVIIPHDTISCGEEGYINYVIKNKQNVLNPVVATYTSIFSLVITKDNNIIYESVYKAI